MKRIVIINHYGITPDMPGATRHYDLAQYFKSKREFDVEFWMCGYNHHTGTHIKELKHKIQYKYIDNGVNIVKVKSIPYRNNLIMRQLNIMFFDLITGLKILFSTNIKIIVLSMPPITFFTTWICNRKKVKLVADVEDLWPLFLNDMGMNNRFASAYMEKVANYTYNSAYSIEAVSNGMLDYVRGKCKKQDKHMWLSPLGVNLDLYESSIDSHFIEKYEWNDDFKIMYVGAHGKANDIEAVLQTIKIFNDKYIEKMEKRVSFIFFGNGENKGTLLKLKTMLNLKNVYFEDAIPGCIVPYVLKTSDICLTNLMKIESFKLVRPNKIFQYMAARKPIICGIWGESRQIVEESQSGVYVDFTNASKASKIIFELIKYSDLNKMGKNGHQYICKNGNRQIIFEEFYYNLKQL